jgi:peroxiredoxin Q/BCP
MRHSLIIDPQGVIQETFVKVNPNIHSTEVLARLEKLQSEERV